MKRLLILVVAVLVPFGALVVWGLSSLDTAAPPPAPLPNVPPTAVVAPGENAREGVARALQPPTGPAPQAVAAASPQRVSWRSGWNRRLSSSISDAIYLPLLDAWNARPLKDPGNPAKLDRWL